MRGSSKIRLVQQSVQVRPHNSQDIGYYKAANSQINYILKSGC